MHGRVAVEVEAFPALETSASSAPETSASAALETSASAALETSASAALETSDTDLFLAAQSQRSLLRFITCGSVDDGKSTLIGRLLYESKLLFDDQLVTFEQESKRNGTQGGGFDFALLVDGLAAEREQGITIDVAYRFFATDKRKFIVADTPGHEQYTRNMATGASTCDLAIILIDARKGVLSQTKRHSVIVSMLGVRRVVLAVNKMDMVGYSERAFAEIVRDYRAFAEPLGFAEIVCIPISALKGDNVIEASPNMAWYQGPSVLAQLERVEVEEDAQGRPFRMPVQWVSRPNQEFRGFAGLVTSGTVWLGDRLRVLPSGKESRVQRIVTYDGELDRAVAGQSITLTLEDEIDISRGDVLCVAAEPASVGDRLEAKVLWLSEQELRPDQNYLIKIGAKTLGATLARPRHRLDINTLERAMADTLRLNETGLVDLLLDQRIAADLYERARETGSFIVIDRLSNDTVGMGFIERVLGVENVGLAAMEMPDGMEGAAVESRLVPQLDAPEPTVALVRRVRTFTVFNYRVTIEARPQRLNARTVGGPRSAIRDFLFRRPSVMKGDEP